MIGFHFQVPIVGWTEAVQRLPTGSPVKAIDNVQMLKDAKMANASCVTILRHWAEPLYGEAFDPNSDRHEVARRFFQSFVDDTFRLYAPYVDYIEEFNEYLANSQSPEERADRIAWASAVAEIWANEYRIDPDFAHIRLILANAAIGNDIPWEFARIAKTYDAALGYHPYLPVRNKIPLQGEWPYYSGRWTVMDADFVRRGYEVDWMFTEGGAVLYGITQNGSVWLGPNDGWRHRDAYDASLPDYIFGLCYFLEAMLDWNHENDNRVKGLTLFNSGNAGQWPLFQIQQPEMSVIASAISDFVESWNPVDEPPTPGDELNDVLWGTSMENQCISLNPDAAIQKRIHLDGFVPVGSEYRLYWGGLEYACHPAEHLDSGDRRVYWAVVPRWDSIFFLENHDGRNQ